MYHSFSVEFFPVRNLVPYEKQKNAFLRALGIADLLVLNVSCVSIVRVLSKELCSCFYAVVLRLTLVNALDNIVIHVSSFIRQASVLFWVAAFFGHTSCKQLFQKKEVELLRFLWSSKGHNSLMHLCWIALTCSMWHIFNASVWCIVLLNWTAWKLCIYRLYLWSLLKVIN